MIASILFISWRILELVILIPIMGMLAYFVNIYNSQNQLTPAYILVLFIVSTLAVAWCLVTVIKIGSVRRNSWFVAFIDLCFMGGLIAGVYYLRGITSDSCVTSSGGVTSSGTPTTIAVSYDPFSLSADKVCTMLKASFGLAIVALIFFVVTALIAITMRNKEAVVEKRSTRSTSHGSRRGHSSSREHRRSSRDSRRNYYV